MNDQTPEYLTDRKAAQAAMTDLQPNQIALQLHIPRPCGCHMVIGVIAEHSFFASKDWCGCHIVGPNDLTELLRKAGKELLVSYGGILTDRIPMPPCDKHPGEFQCPGLNKTSGCKH